MNQLEAIHPKLEEIKIVSFIKDTFKNAGKTTAVVAISGGVDSATSAALAVKALGAKNVHALILPSLQSSTKNTEDGIRMAEFLKIPDSNIHEINIAAGQEAVAKTLKLYNVDRSDQHLQARLGNIAARLRMVFIFDQAKALNALVIGTENKSEHFLAYYTRFGDEASDLEPIKHLYKTQVFALAAHLKVPQEIIKKTPTADLWVGQSDEEEMGFSYIMADPILHEHYENGKSREEIQQMGYKQDLVDKIINYVESIKFKHAVPYHL